MKGFESGVGGFFREPPCGLPLDPVLEFLTGEFLDGVVL